MKYSEKIKKTYYIENDLIKQVKIKAAIEETTETDTINSIVKEYFKTNKNKELFID